MTQGLPFAVPLPKPSDPLHVTGYSVQAAQIMQVLPDEVPADVTYLTRARYSGLWTEVTPQNWHKAKQAGMTVRIALDYDRKQTEAKTDD